MNEGVFISTNCLCFFATSSSNPLRMRRVLRMQIINHSNVMKQFNFVVYKQFSAEFRAELTLMTCGVGVVVCQTSQLLNAACSHRPPRQHISWRFSISCDLRSGAFNLPSLMPLQPFTCDITRTMCRHHRNNVSTAQKQCPQRSQFGEHEERRLTAISGSHKIAPQGL